MKWELPFVKYGLALALLVLAAFVGLLVLVEFKARDVDVEAALQHYDQLRAIATLRSSIETTAALNNDAGTLLFDSSSPAANSAMLLANIKVLAAKFGIEITSAEDVSSKPGGLGFAMNLQISGRSSAIYHFFEDIQLQRPLVLIDSYSIRSNVQNQSLEQVETPLIATLILRGQMKPPR